LNRSRNCKENQKDDKEKKKDDEKMTIKLNRQRTKSENCESLDQHCLKNAINVVKISHEV